MRPRSPLIERYTLPEMGAVWSEQAKFQSWLEVEIAATEANCRLGRVPQEPDLSKPFPLSNDNDHPRCRGLSARCRKDPALRMPFPISTLSIKIDGAIFVLCLIIIVMYDYDILV